MQADSIGHGQMLMLIAKGSEWLRQLQSQLKDVAAFVKDFAKNSILIVYVEERASSKKKFEMCNNSAQYHLIGVIGTYPYRRLFVVLQ